MVFRVLGAILVLFAAYALGQYHNIYVRSEPRSVPYEKTQQEIVHNFLNNKPLLNYIPVYNTEYGQWEAATKGSQKVDLNKIKEAEQNTNRVANVLPSPDLELQKLGDIMTRLKSDMLILSHQAKQSYDVKIKELEEIKKLSNDLSVALQNADTLKNNLQTHEKQLREFAKNVQNNDGFSRVNQSGVEEFMHTMGNLEAMVQNISSKYGGKLGM